MKVFKTIVILLFIVAIGIFAVQNTDMVTISYLNWYLEIPLYIGSILFYILGGISGGLLFSMLKKLTQDSDKEKK